MKHGFCLLCACLLCFVLPVQAWAATQTQDGSVVHIKTEEAVVALTFDDGPHPRYTPRVLDVLAKYGVKATFFEVGVNVERYPKVARAVAEAGHEIGNHTFHHKHIASLDERGLYNEVEACNQAIFEATGVRPTLYRPPEGVLGDSRYAQLTSMGFRQILWNVDTLDWRGTNAIDIVSKLMQVRGGDIVLFHDYVVGDLASDTALDTCLAVLQARGMRFVTVTELLSHGEVVTPHF